MPLPMVLATAVPRKKAASKIEECRPDHRQLRRKHARGNHGRNAVGGVVKAVQKIKKQGRGNGDDQQYQSCIHPGVHLNRSGNGDMQTSGALKRDRLKHVGCVFSLVGRAFQYFV